MLYFLMIMVYFNTLQGYISYLKSKSFEKTDTAQLDRLE